MNTPPNNNVKETHQTGDDSSQSAQAVSNKQPQASVRRQPTKLNNERIRQILEDEEKLQQHLQPLFHAMLRGSPLQQEQQQKIREQQQQQQQSTKQRQPPPAPPPTREKVTQLRPSKAPPLPSNVPIDDYIPQQHDEIRQTAIFKQLYRQIQFQRDQYLVGSEYATWQHKERDILPTDPNDRLPKDRTAWGPQQLTRIAADFIPSETVRDSVVPLVTPFLDNRNNALYPLLQSATTNAILEQQDNLNGIVKSALLGFLNNPHNRLTIKKSTHGFIETKYNEGEQ